MPSLSWLLIAVCVLLVIAPQGAFAFGAGNIPSYAYLEGIAFRHGDIEDVLAELLKRTGTGLLSKGHKFGGLDIKRVYFGNWLRDYSQAVDVAMLKQTTMQNIMNIVMVLGFLAHGYATEEFQVTEERLGIYLPVEHIDNPRGYPDNARQYHPKLRGPVDPRELEIDLRTGMKNYIANESGTWDTSKALVRRTLEKCIWYGRQYRTSNNKADSYEAYRLLGTALHTLEDFPAHSNFCELALVSMGHTEVFTHVGDSVRLRAPSGKMVAPLVTGTFGGDDFIHSLLGEASDHISQASVSELNTTVNHAKNKQKQGAGANQLKALISKIPSSEGGNMAADVDQMTAPPPKNPETMDPRELYANIWRILTIRDTLVKKIEKVIEKIPGLGSLLEELMNSIAVLVFTTLEPYLKPLMQTATKQLTSASGDVIKSHDQEEVFRDPYSSDPTHSYLSKDHFNLILNEPSGNIAKIIVIHTVKAVVNAWENPNIQTQQVIEPLLECLFHPDFHNPNSLLQREMLDYMRKWINSSSAGQHSIIQRLTKESVRRHHNIRKQGDQNHASIDGYGSSHPGSHTSNFAIPGVAIPGMGGSAHSSSGGPTALGLVSKIPGLEGVAKVDKIFQQMSVNEGGKPPKEKKDKDKKDKKDKDKDKKDKHKKRDGEDEDYEDHAGSAGGYYAPPSHGPSGSGYHVSGQGHSAGYGIPDPSGHVHGGSGMPPIPGGYSGASGTSGGGYYGSTSHGGHGHAYELEEDDDDDDEEEEEEHGKKKKKDKKDKGKKDKDKKDKKDKKEKDKKDKDKDKKKDKHGDDHTYNYPEAHRGHEAGPSPAPYGPPTGFPEANLYTSPGYAPPSGPPGHHYGAPPSMPSAPGLSMPSAPGEYGGRSSPIPGYAPSYGGPPGPPPGGFPGGPPPFPPAPQGPSQHYGSPPPPQFPGAPGGYGHGRGGF